MLTKVFFDKYIGIPYQYGGHDCRIGMDCWTIAQRIIMDLHGVYIDDSRQYIVVPSHDHLNFQSLVEFAYDSKPALLLRAELAPDSILISHRGDKETAVGYWTGERIITARPGRTSFYLSLATWLRIFDKHVCFSAPKERTEMDAYLAFRGER